MLCIRIIIYQEQHYLLLLSKSPSNACSPLTSETHKNKKVLLRECKRHTARHIANACFADGGMVPHPVLDGGVPHHDLGWGYPPSARCGTPQSRPRMWYPLPIWTWAGVLPHPDLGWGSSHQDM